MCDQHLIPLSVFELDFDKPVDGWSTLFEAENVDVVEDAIGRASIACEDAGRLIAASRAARAYAEAERARQVAEWAARYPVPRGVPAVEGATAFESMLAADAADRPRSLFEELFDAELAAGKGT